MYIFDCMWQKLNYLDLARLEHARNQIINILQLVNGGPKSFRQDSDSCHTNYIHWNKETNSFESAAFGPGENIFIALDIEQFVLSIIGPDNKKEHLVLSGMTYPMAFGWMGIKLERFGLDIRQFNDKTDYKIEHTLKPWDEIDTSNDRIYDQIPLYYSNAEFILKSLRNRYLKDKGDVFASPQTANLVLSYNSGPVVHLGFSLGNRPFPEPYYYLELSGEPRQLKNLTGLWNERKNELVLLASDFLSKNQDQDVERILHFFESNLKKID